MQVINRCRHDDFVTDDRALSFLLAKAAVKMKLPGAYHYLVSSFFFPPVRKERTTLIPPILRQEVLQSRRGTGGNRAGGRLGFAVRWKNSRGLAGQ